MLEGMGVEGMQGESSLDILPREENVGERAGLELVDLVLLAAKMDGSFFLVGNWLLLLLPALHHGIAKIPGADGP